MTSAKDKLNNKSNQNPVDNQSSSTNNDNRAFTKISDELEQIKDKRLEERFFAFLIIIILFDALIFHHIQSWGGALVIGILEIFLLIMLAKRSGIQEVDELFDKILRSVGRNSD